LTGFWIGRFEVTNAQFEQFRKRPRPPESLADNQPVTRVSWEDAVAFCRWLSKKEDKKYRLPTEAEWEYAARGGLVQKQYPWGNDPIRDDLAVLARSVTFPVGSCAPNGYGLYDMVGNVEEWVSDWYDENYYARSPLQDPQGPSKPLADNQRLRRGGFFAIFEGGCADRHPWFSSLRPDLSRIHEEDQGDGSGFRVVLETASPNASSRLGAGGKR
jgi:formylglycine-generating enzyme required for sulfatase activity